MSLTYWRCSECKELRLEEDFPAGSLICKRCRRRLYKKTETPPKEDGGVRVGLATTR